MRNRFFALAAFFTIIATAFGFGIVKTPDTDPFAATLVMIVLIAIALGCAIAAQNCDERPPLSGQTCE